MYTIAAISIYCFGSEQPRTAYWKWSKVVL